MLIAGIAFLLYAAFMYFGGFSPVISALWTAAILIVIGLVRGERL